MVIDFGCRNAIDPVFPMNGRNGMGQIQRNIIVIQALYHITGQAVREGADFQDSLDFTAFQGHTAGHDEANIATTEDDNFLTRQITFHVDHALSRTSREDASRTIARDTDGTACTFAATHREDNRLALYFHQSVSRADSGDRLVRVDAEDHGIDEDFDFWFIFD